MAWLESLLSRLEARLQTLVEGRSARFSLGGRMYKDLSRRLEQAMWANAVTDAAGEACTAPDVYVVSLPPTQAQELSMDPTALDELSRGLQQAAAQGGLVFKESPVLRIVADPAAREPRLLAQFSAGIAGPTGTLEVGTSGDGSAEFPRGAFLIVDGLQTFPLERGMLTIGRGVDNHLVLEDPRVSRSHAQLRAVGGRFVLFDLDSSGGTFVNGRPVRQQALSAGDVISLAGLPLVYGQDGAASTDQTQQLPAAG